MTDDMFATMDDSELDEEASEEVDKILWEITAGTYNIYVVPEWYFRERFDHVSFVTVSSNAISFVDGFSREHLGYKLSSFRGCFTHGCFFSAQTFSSFVRVSCSQTFRSLADVSFVRKYFSHSWMFF